MRIRVGWLLAVCGIAITAGAMSWAASAAQEARAIAQTVPTPEYGRPFSVLWLGDTLLGDASSTALRANGYQWAFEQHPPIDGADLTVVNAEGPITPLDEHYFPDQQWSYDSRRAAAIALGRAGVDLASLANNHAYDRGPNGLRDTINALKDAGVTATGAGTPQELDSPTIVSTPSGPLAILAFAEAGDTTPAATDSMPGVRVMTFENVTQGVERARALGARWVVAFVHWGDNYTYILPEQRDWAQLFARSGYDLVVGTGPHIMQPVELIGKTPVAYSIGNFAFGTPGRFSLEYPGYGIALTTVLTPDGFRELRMECVLTDNEVIYYQPRPCDAPTSDRVLRLLHPGVRMEGTTGVLRW